MIGQVLSHYQVLEKLGEGGMGVVYRAQDTRLNRSVALKVLPHDALADAARRERFVHEARSASALNHPNIITVYEVDSSDGVDFIAMEYVTGRTLAQLVGPKGLKLTDALKNAVQIADALATAHAAGIVHRDLKPANVMITDAGRVKVLDFGLAKLVGPLAVDGSDVTRTGHADALRRTEPGTILGTVAYMSPEQAEGWPVDARSDIFSFGSLLYEMVTGRRAFAGETRVSTIAAIVEKEPPPASGIAAGVPRELDRLIAHCLRKDPARRFQHLDDVKTLLEQLKEEAESGKLGTTALSASSTSSLSEAGGTRGGAARLHSLAPPFWIAVTAVLLITTLALGWLYRGRTPAAATGAIRFSIPPPENLEFTRLTDIPFSAAVSPDGQRLALIILAAGRTQLWVRSLGGLAAQPLAGTEGAEYPFWSPDSRYIGFVTDGKLKKIDAAGGSPQTLCDAPRFGTVATWNRHGVILFNAFPGGFFRVSAEGGAPALVSKPKANDEYFWPSFLPDGRHFLFLTGFPARDLYVGSLDSSETQLLVRDASRAAYAPPGYLLYVRDGTLLAHPFDAEALRLTGEPILIAEGLWFFKPTGTADFSVSDNGVLTYRTGASVSRLTWRDRRGAEIGSVGEPKDYQGPRISPDGQTVAASIGDPRTGTTDVWTYDLMRGQSARATFDPSMENSPIWSPDGQRIVFSASPDGPPHLYQKSVNDTGIDILIPMSGWVQTPYDWSPDGHFVMYGDGEPKTGNNLMILPLEGGRTPTPFLRTQFNEVEARFSPVGRWVAYMSDESGRFEIYVRSYPDAGPKRQISTAGGSSPTWRRDGKELFYIAPDKRLMAVPVQAGLSFEAGAPAALFRVDARNGPVGYEYDSSADGQRFLINAIIAEANQLPLTAVVNWTVDLKR